jgi:hypothetical protein
MEKKIARAVRNLQQSIQVEPISIFTYIEPSSGNNLKVKIFFDEQGNPALQILKLSGFKEDEIVGKLNSNLRKLILSPLPDAQVNQIVYVHQTANLGQEITLTSGTYYYAVDNSPFYCGGMRLSRDFKAMCMGTMNTKCHPESAVATYTVFKLIL